MTKTDSYQRAYVSQFAVGLGPLFNVQVEVVPVRRTSEGSTGFSNVCPACLGESSQIYTCENNHGPFKVGELQKAKATPQGLIPLSEEDLETLKDDMPVGLLSLHVCPRADIAGATLTEGTSYRLRPAKKAPPGQYALLMAMASHPEFALYGMAKLNARSKTRPVILTAFRGQVVMSQLVPPQEVAQPDALGDLAVPDAYLGMIEELLGLWNAPLEEEVFTDLRSAKIAELVESRIEQAVPAQQPAAAEDIMEALRAAVEQKKPATKARRPRAA
jgi:non-homologous end joining protein Ku